MSYIVYGKANKNCEL